MLQWTDHGGGKRDEGTGTGCCSGQTMVEEREMKEQDVLGDSWRVLQWTDHGGGKRDEGGWTWGFLEGVAVDRPWWRR